MGYPMRGLVGIRIWLTSEAFRWLPGSVWGFGSRAALAMSRGVPATTAAVSVLLELMLTVLAWVVVALSGWGLLREPLRHLRVGTPSPVLVALALASALLAWVWLGRSQRVADRSAALVGQLSSLMRTRPDYIGLGVTLAFYVLMGIFNGLVFETVLLAIPGGTSCPVRAAIAANAMAWLVGFFAIMAPGGLVVREGCLVFLLSAWIPLQQAVIAAMAWRSLQIIAEILCSVSLAALGVVRTSRELGSRTA